MKYLSLSNGYRFNINRIVQLTDLFFYNTAVLKPYIYLFQAQDGTPLPKLLLADVRQSIGFVQQEPILFDRTIGENIAYGNNSRTPNMDEIINAAKQANIHNFVSSLPLVSNQQTKNECVNK